MDAFSFVFSLFGLLMGLALAEAIGGFGKALIIAGLAAARARGLKVIPICPFFAAYMKKHPEVQDLLDPAYRKTLGLN